MTYHFQNKSITKLIISYLLVFTLSFGSFILVGTISPLAAQKAKLKSISVSMKKAKTLRKVKNTYYMVTGTSSKIRVKPKLTRKVRVRPTIKFKSSKKKIISVTKTGKVKARKSGQAYITVKVTIKKTKTLSKSSKAKKFRIVSLSRAAFNKKFGSATKPTTPATPSTAPKEKTMQEILDGMVDSSGTLRLTTDFYNKYPQYKENNYTYKVPTETTKAKKIVLPKLNSNNQEQYDLSSFRTDIIYSVPCNINFYYSYFNHNTILSNNQANIRNASSHFYINRKGEFTGDPYHLPDFLGWDGGVSKIKIQNRNNQKWYTFQFEVYNPDYNTKEYKVYAEMKKISQDAFKNCKNDKEKFQKIMELVQMGKIGNASTFSYNCEVYANYTSEYANLNGIPCLPRTAFNDWDYGQPSYHVNCLVLLDGKVYVADPKNGNLFPYSDFCDINCRYLDYTNSRGSNLKGIIDKNLDAGPKAFLRKELLEKGGYHPQISNG